MDNNAFRIRLDTISLPELYYCGILTASAPFLHADRILDFDVMICVLQGAMYVTEEDTDYVIQENEVLFLKSGAHHFGRGEIPKGTRWFFAHFHTDAIPPDKESSFPVPKTAAVDSRFCRKLEKMCEVFASSNEIKKIKRNMMFYDILTDLLQGSAEKEQTLSDRICAFLDTQISRNFTRELIERAFFLSYSYMASVFVKEKGMSPGSYHNSARMKKAAELLRSTAISVSETASALGFDDALYFSRKFKAVFGVSPAKYRKQALEKY